MLFGLQKSFSVIFVFLLWLFKWYTAIELGKKNFTLLTFIELITLKKPSTLTLCDKYGFFSASVLNIAAKW